MKPSKLIVVLVVTIKVTLPILIRPTTARAAEVDKISSSDGTPGAVPVLLPKLGQQLPQTFHFPSLKRVRRAARATRVPHGFRTMIVPPQRPVRLKRQPSNVLKKRRRLRFKPGGKLLLVALERNDSRSSPRSERVACGRSCLKANSM